MSVWWVDAKNGNDTSGIGSTLNPWKKITKAVDEALPGDTVMVNPGIYPETITIDKDDITVEGRQRIM